MLEIVFFCSSFLMRHLRVAYRNLLVKSVSKKKEEQVLKWNLVQDLSPKSVKCNGVIVRRFCFFFFVFFCCGGGGCGAWVMSWYLFWINTWVSGLAWWMKQVWSRIPHRIYELVCVLLRKEALWLIRAYSCHWRNLWVATIWTVYYVRNANLKGILYE